MKEKCLERTNYYYLIAMLQDVITETGTGNIF